MVDNPGMDGENTLHALAEADLAHRDALAHPDIVARNYGAFEGLQAFLVAFLNLHVHANGVARPELGGIGAFILVDDFRQQGVVHFESLILHCSRVKWRPKCRYAPSPSCSAPRALSSRKARSPAWAPFPTQAA